MAGETKLEDDSDHQTPTNHLHNVPDPNPKATKSTSHSKDKGSHASASAKRRCVSTACIACRRRKSKVHSCVILSTLRGQCVAD